MSTPVNPNMDNTWKNRDAFDRDPLHLTGIYATLADRLKNTSYTDRTALDIGMGMGCDAAFLARRGYAVDGLDISKIAVDKVQMAAQLVQLNITTHQTTLTNYQPADSKKKYDVALMLRLLHLLTPPEQTQTLLCMESFLKPDGYAVLRVLTDKSGKIEMPGMLRAGELERRFSGWDIKYSEKNVRIPVKLLDGSDGYQVFDDLIAQRK